MIQQHHWKWPTASFSQAFFTWKIAGAAKITLDTPNAPADIGRKLTQFVAIAATDGSGFSRTRRRATLRLSRLLTVEFWSSAVWQKRGASQ
jgi:hypothetical protein